MDHFSILVSAFSVSSEKQTKERKKAVFSSRKRKKVTKQEGQEETWGEIIGGDEYG